MPQGNSSTGMYGGQFAALPLEIQCQRLAYLALAGHVEKTLTRTSIRCFSYGRLPQGSAELQSSPLRKVFQLKIPNGIIRPRESRNEEAFSAVILAIVGIGLLLSGLGSTAVSVEHTAGLGNEIAANVSQTRNSSASATITITMHAGDDE